MGYSLGVPEDVCQQRRETCRKDPAGPLQEAKGEIMEESKPLSHLVGIQCLGSDTPQNEDQRFTYLPWGVVRS